LQASPGSTVHLPSPWKYSLVAICCRTTLMTTPCSNPWFSRPLNS